MLLSLQEHLMNSHWVLGNLPEPPMEPSDQFVVAGLVKPRHSRFDAFIASNSSQHTCHFFLWENMRYCSETNYRRERLRVHLLAHFSYTPYPCEGKCGKSNWRVALLFQRISLRTGRSHRRSVLAFADNGLLVEHVRRNLRPRVQCEFW